MACRARPVGVRQFHGIRSDSLGKLHANLLPDRLVAFVRLQEKKRKEKTIPSYGITELATLCSLFVWLSEYLSPTLLVEFFFLKKNNYRCSYAEVSCAKKKMRHSSSAAGRPGWWWVDHNLAAVQLFQKKKKRFGWRDVASNIFSRRNSEWVGNWAACRCISRAAVPIAPPESARWFRPR